MRGTLAFALGFVAGWATRSTLDSFRSVTVQVVALALDATASIKRAMAIELERVEDLIAEARDVVARKRADRAEQHNGGGRPVEHAA